MDILWFVEKVPLTYINIPAFYIYADAFPKSKLTVPLRYTLKKRKLSVKWKNRNIFCKFTV